MDWDRGPEGQILTIIKQAPINEYASRPKRFRLEWGPIYYRGRLDGSAKVLVIGQDPAPDENVARRILVGDAGQRVQRFLAKLGITHSYVMVNSILYSIYGQFDDEMSVFMDLPTVAQWRNRLLNALAGSNIKVILAFGKAAGHVVDSWPDAASFKSQGRVFNLLHPTARPASKVLANWSAKLPQIAPKVTADSDGTVDTTPYAGPGFKAGDLARIPLRDLAFGVPEWMGTGDMAVRRTVNGKQAILWKALDKDG